MWPSPSEFDNFIVTDVLSSAFFSCFLYANKTGRSDII